MRIRRAKKRDFPRVTALARTLSLDYSGMESDEFWVASDGGEVAAICGLKKHPDCRELISLGVHPACRGRGLGRRLVLALIKETPGDIYLTTVIPAFFEKLGFQKTSHIPVSVVKEADWCEGCDRALCAAMVRRAE
ncbi:MAG: GNAT family N-acetyltransferase [Acidobacteriota bacterium]|nr:GNAT family N-acetyltransferase [Acidobacteriota bacterium]